MKVSISVEDLPLWGGNLEKAIFNLEEAYKEVSKNLKDVIENTPVWKKFIFIVPRVQIEILEDELVSLDRDLHILWDAEYSFNLLEQGNVDSVQLPLSVIDLIQEYSCSEED